MSRVYAFVKRAEFPIERVSLSITYLFAVQDFAPNGDDGNTLRIKEAHGSSLHIAPASEY